MKVKFKYKNYKSEVRQRIVIPIKIEYTSTEYHPDNQWILVGYDIEKADIRHFAMKDISDWQPL